MAKILVKLYDDEVDLEEFIIVDEDGVERIKEILEEYRKADPEYSVDAFLEELEANGIEYESLPVEKIYF